jgi:ketosteroid isomerase-like protein
MTADVREFFARYEKTNAEFDVAALATLYADTFMFGGPAGVRCVKKEDFIKAIPKRKEQFASLGLMKSTVSNIQETRLDSKFLMAKVSWTMALRGGTKGEAEIPTSATYILEQTTDALTIVMQIDHQDLGAKLKEFASSR